MCAWYIRPDLCVVHPFVWYLPATLYISCIEPFFFPPPLSLSLFPSPSLTLTSLFAADDEDILGGILGKHALVWIDDRPSACKLACNSARKSWRAASILGATVTAHPLIIGVVRLQSTCDDVDAHAYMVQGGAGDFDLDEFSSEQLAAAIAPYA